jgi:hypothetical protein
MKLPRLIAAGLLTVLLTAATARAEPPSRPLSTPEKALIAAAVTAAVDFRWFSYRPSGKAETAYCAMAAIPAPVGGLSVFVPFFAIVGPGRGPLGRARLVALGTAEPLAPLNLLITEMCDRAGYGF